MVLLPDPEGAEKIRTLLPILESVIVYAKIRDLIQISLFLH
jgi:hypothetical protein